MQNSNRVLAEAVKNKITLVEIIPGKGSGQLKNVFYDSKRNVPSAGKGRQEFWQNSRTFQALGQRYLDERRHWSRLLTALC